ncbi:MAG: hypothetical protein LBD70_05260 [Bifidobacteriaceae bacterium]|nr:hypothetical protein [Bifidobacteriaceae bacterium]
MDTATVLSASYQPRVVHYAVARALSLAGGVLLEGARACGKTMTGLNAAASYIFLDSDEAELARQVSPWALLDGAARRRR